MIGNEEDSTRALQLSSKQCFDLHLVQAPLTREAAPPGHYMLFILDPDRVPSEGKILKLR